MLIRIDTLYSLDDVGSQYYFDTESLSVINADTKLKKKVSVNKRGYPVVYLGRKSDVNSVRKQRNVPMHKIVALSMIANEPYKLIEHLDDNKMNYAPENLLFSDNRTNTLRMYKNGITNHHDKTFVLETIDGEIYTGTMKELSAITKIPRATLYDRYYFKRENKKHRISNIHLSETVPQ